jgi:hypothetical protein
MQQVAFCTHFTGSRSAPRLRAKSLPMISCMRKGKYGWPIIHIDKNLRFMYLLNESFKSMP